MARGRLLDAGPTLACEAMREGDDALRNAEGLTGAHRQVADGAPASREGLESATRSSVTAIAIAWSARLGDVLLDAVDVLRDRLGKAALPGSKARVVRGEEFSLVKVTQHPQRECVGAFPPGAPGKAPSWLDGLFLQRWRRV